MVRNRSASRAHPGTSLPRTSCSARRCCLIKSLEVAMPIILWLLGVPLVVVVLLMLTHVI
jgi:hypothetical protein